MRLRQVNSITSDSESVRLISDKQALSAAVKPFCQKTARLEIEKKNRRRHVISALVGAFLHTQAHRSG